MMLSNKESSDNRFQWLLERSPGCGGGDSGAAGASGASGGAGGAGGGSGGADGFIFG